MEYLAYVLIVLFSSDETFEFARQSDVTLWGPTQDAILSPFTERFNSLFSFGRIWD